MRGPHQLDLLGPGSGPSVGAALDGPVRRAPATPSALRLGTSSWHFPGWAGLVYATRAPPTLLARAGLEAYASHPVLRTVGVDRSYYAMPDEATWLGYAQQVGGDFDFVVKAPRWFTSPRLSGRPNPAYLEPEAAPDTLAPLVAGLGSRLGPLVLQFPPGQPDEPRRFARRLIRFLRGLPAGLLVAVELRTPRLLGRPYRAALRAGGAHHCFTVHPAMPGLAEQAASVGGCGRGPFIARWNLGHGQRYARARRRYQPFDRLVDTDPDSRAALASGALRALRAGYPAWITVNNKAEGSAPLSVCALAEAVRPD